MFNQDKKNIISKENKKNPLISLVNNFLLQYFKMVLIGFTILTLLLGYFFVLKPKYTQIKKDVALTNENTKNTSDNLKNYLLALNKYIKDYEKVESGVQEKISKVLPVGSNKESMYVLIEQIAKNENLFLTSLEITDSSIKAKTSEKNKDVSGVPGELGIISIDLSFMGGGYTNLKSLLNVLEQNLQIMDVRSINFNPSNSAISLSLDTYYLKTN
ncbi:hypothetical protein A2331_02210 [Candidatus Falkowbacteria bacterium RIFOXYB2_FULL_34_18]|uniref:Pilus assembly protein PilO n=1 Tax=Candidatus Falkowbacteria bacterium RIFOXYD2_FULL_34_120 TaxID=1798007 RepID=A0A1F5TQP9_9BACT|nr:MAG: hypothetical protein A2331_02210 [Candidatus Falkowbacteria bacterium RIFOXYB2_FULL_34_18]OGF29518.1 MAG: hypothetical protein A2500_02320 [Candidatus Falkowbacteria bacterium RIFOXYC12_FULL_34_55]OGF36872.1 MAG: hypothetical protein A2466_06650 [Candidatus Falkowbacteria bacterium RIFOXYC2_FULL_34_220]OGF39071.1 MAG: hypothetical protein A2515_04655 [Candidatus Falkowbacteria bacterium RIFOXYD12_FULL_34_57]OGF41276.1 MAG: hypothetical protein A2531_00235 [Candidatus Falkowbacteria bact